MLKDPEVRKFITHGVLFLSLVAMLFTLIFHGVPEEGKPLFWMLALWIASLLHIPTLTGGMPKVGES